MKFKSFAVLAGALVCHSAFATLTLTGNFVQINLSADGALVNGGTAGIKYNSAGTGGASGVDFNKWGTPIGDHTFVVNNTDSFTRYAFGTFGSLAVSSFAITDTSIVGVQRASMVTTFTNGIRHTRTYELHDNDKFFTVYDRYLNLTGSTITLAQVDAIDPDQGIPFGQGFGTANDVDVAANRVTASTYGLSMYMDSDDLRARATVIPFALSTYDPYLATYDPNGAFNDYGIAMAVDYGRVRNGRTVGSDYVIGFSGEPVPEPATMAALGIGLAALARRRRKV